MGNNAHKVPLVYWLHFYAKNTHWFQKEPEERGDVRRCDRLPVCERQTAASYEHQQEQRDRRWVTASRCERARRRNRKKRNFQGLSWPLLPGSCLRRTQTDARMNPFTPAVQITWEIKMGWRRCHKCHWNHSSDNPSIETRGLNVQLSDDYFDPLVIYHY